MPTINPYLTFDGTCEQAFGFYQSVFGGEFTFMGRFSEMPEGAMGCEMPESAAQRIMHVSLPIGEHTILMGSDSMPGQPVQAGSNFAVSINCKDREEVDNIFTAMSEGGNITMPLSDTFWGSYFGMLVDKFGIQWMVDCEVQTCPDGE